jgi:hypothetical protein
VRFALDRWGQWLALEDASVEGIQAQPGLVGKDPETGELIQPIEHAAALDSSLGCLKSLIPRKLF